MTNIQMFLTWKQQKSFVVQPTHQCGNYDNREGCGSSGGGGGVQWGHRGGRERGRQSEESERFFREVEAYTEFW